MTHIPAIGVLALQGDFAEHEASLRHAGAHAFQVRTEAQLNAADALIVPGGESTSMAKLLDAYHLREPVRQFALSGKPVWGTCAGLILLAGELHEDRPEPLHLMDTVVQRNGFGRQIDSFHADIHMEGLEDGTFHAIFIRAPVIHDIGPDVDVLARLDDGRFVAARQGNLLVTAFHPELTPDDRVHRYFLSMATAEAPA